MSGTLLCCAIVVEKWGFRCFDGCGFGDGDLVCDGVGFVDMALLLWCIRLYFIIDSPILLYHPVFSITFGALVRLEFAGSI